MRIVGLSVVLVAAFLLSGCAQYQAAKNVVVEKKGEYNDEKLKLGLRLVCDEASVGAVRRAYNGDFSAWSKAFPHYSVVLPE